MWTAVPEGTDPPLKGELFVGAGDERYRVHQDALLQAWPYKDLGGDVVYSVFDGDRSGLWRTGTQ